MYRKVRLLNVEVDDVTMEQLVENFRQGVLLTLHVDMIMKLQQDREFYELLPKFDVITCDSQILTIAARLLGTPLKERVSGSDYFPRFCTRYRDDLLSRYSYEEARPVSLRVRVARSTPR
jgi:UDP-N-acetyl-D-mannosaminuronic acid transferase (WecB/TagA/CpsF family)